MSVLVEFQGTHINIINVHLSIWPSERIIQTDALLSRQWLGQNNSPTILCGDFSAVPGSAVYRKVCAQFKDSQDMLKGYRPSRTWFGRYSFVQLDHIFVISQFQVNAVVVPHTSLDVVASDHLPLMVDVSLITN